MMTMKTLSMTPASPGGISRNSPRVRIRGRIVRTSGGHDPTLPTIQMVAAAIKNAKQYPSKYQLWRSLPKSMQYPTLKKVLTYLESTNQIMIDKDGTIIWSLADNPQLKKLLAQSIHLR
jgi:hypothetical protein